MAKKNADTNYNTNLASEYLMMSLLCRAGKDAYLSLGNKKGVDIIVKTVKDCICILEVKGIDCYNWPISTNGTINKSPNLFYAFVSFNKKITELTSMPDFWLIPSELLAEKNKHKTGDTKKTVNITRKHIIDNYKKYKNTFKYLNKYLEIN